MRATYAAPILSIDQCFEATASEREVLIVLAAGATDEEIVAATGLNLWAVRSRLRRFYERSEISGRFAVAWCSRHRDCCLGQP